MAMEAPTEVRLRVDFLGDAMIGGESINIGRYTIHGWYGIRVIPFFNGEIFQPF